MGGGGGGGEDSDICPHEKPKIFQWSSRQTFGKKIVILPKTIQKKMWPSA